MFSFTHFEDMTGVQNLQMHNNMTMLKIPILEFICHPQSIHELRGSASHALKVTGLDNKKMAKFDPCTIDTA